MLNHLFVNPLTVKLASAVAQAPEGADVEVTDGVAETGNQAANEAGKAAPDKGIGADTLTDPEQVQHLFETYGIPTIKVIVMLIAAFLVAAWAGRVVTRMCTKSKIEMTLARFFGKMAKWGVMVLALLSILSIFGVQTTSFAAVIGAAGLAVGLAFQGTLGNFASGIMLLVFRPFTVGDVVTVAGTTGKVFEIDLFNTALDTPDNVRVIVPNGAVFGSTITNISYHDTRRVDVAVGTDYPADLDAARSTLLDAAKGIDHVLTDPEPAVVLCDLGDSCINWSVRVWVNAADYWAVKDALTREVKNRLDAADIGIPFPQMDVHIDGKLAG